MHITERVTDDVQCIDAASATDLVATDATVAVSGFGSVGYPKTVPGAIRETDDRYGLTLISGGSLGGEIDTDLVEADAIDRRFPYQSQPASRQAINESRIQFHDRHISSLSDEVEFGQYGNVVVAIVEAVAVGVEGLDDDACFLADVLGGDAEGGVAGGAHGPSDVLFPELGEAGPGDPR